MPEAVQCSFRRLLGREISGTQPDSGITCNLSVFLCVCLKITSAFRSVPCEQRRVSQRLSLEHGQLSPVCLPLGMGVSVTGSNLERILLKATQKLCLH